MWTGLHHAQHRARSGTEVLVCRQYPTSRRWWNDIIFHASFEGGVLVVTHCRSCITIDPCIPTKRTRACVGKCTRYSCAAVDLLP